MKRLPLLVVGLFLLADRAEAQAKSTLEICSDEEGAAEILRRLDGWMSTARIEQRPLAGCDDPSAAYRGRFVTAPAGPSFHLRNPSGGTLAQSLPWLAPGDTPLATIDREQRLPQFSILLESLLAEDRLGLAVPPPAPEPPPRPKPRRPRPAREAPPKADAAPPPTPARPEPQPQTPPASPPEAEPPPADAGEGPPDPAPEELPFLDLRPDDEAPPPPEAPAPPPRPPGQEDFGDPVPPSIWHWSAEAFGALRLRSPDFYAPETGVGLAFGPLGLRLGLQLPTRWHLEGRPLGVSAYWASLELRHATRIPWAELGLSLGINAESVAVERLDLPWADAHRYLDLGPSMGMELRRGLLGGRMALGVEVGGMPTARVIRLPEGGGALLGGVWGRLSLRWGLGL